MIKKITALLLTLAIIFVALPFNYSINTTAASGMNIWSGGVATAFAGGSGTESDPYLISNGEQLALLAQQVNSGNTYSGKYFEMTNDIYLNKPFKEFTEEETANANEWMPIGGHDEYGIYDITNSFAGGFDGGNYTVYGLYINQTDESYGKYIGLFGVFSNVLPLKNLSVSNAYITGYSYVGGIAGKSSCVITNCYFSGKLVAVSNTSYAGGISGYAKKSVNKCGNYGIIEGRHYVGGIIGYFHNEERITGNATVSQCYNQAPVTGYWYSGGIIGEIYLEDGTFTLTECYNTATITSDDGAGGIVGYITFSYRNDLIRLDNSYNSGNIISSRWAGTIVGYFSSNNIRLYSLNNCYNTGKIFYLDGTENDKSYWSGSFSSKLSNDDMLNYHSIDGSCTVICLSPCKLDQQSTYSGWDFENIWEFDYSNGYIYPQLKNLPHISASKRYFSDEEAKLFFSFVFDCSVTDDALIEESSLYKYMTGRLTTAEEEENARVALLTLVYSCLDSCIEDAEYSLTSSESGIMEYLSSKVSDNAEEDVVNEIVGGILKDIQKGIGATAVAQLSNVDFDYIMENAGIINSALSLKGAPNKGKEYAEKLKALAASYIYADSIETLNMYKYFSSYINARKNFSSADDENFRLLMDTYQLVLEDSQSLAPLASIISGKSIIDLILNFFTGKSSDWTRAEHIALLERWAEFIYQTSELVKQKAESLQNGEEELYKPHFTVNLNGTIAITYGSNISTLNVKAEADTDSDIIYKWYINDTASTTGGKVVGSGSYYKPSGLSCGTHYLYAVAENRNGYGISDDITAVSGIKKIIVDHSYIATVKSPTCLDGGYTNYDCKGCTKAYIDDYTNALGHSYSSDWTTDIEPTCTSVGSQSHHCIRCEVKTDITEMEMTEHSLGEWITDIESTLTEIGKRHKNCLVCGGDFSYEVIPLRILGDISNDNLINSIDVTMARKALLKTLILSDIDKSVADVNEDNCFDIIDLVRLKKQSATA